jgi:hypothetical protein
LLAYASGCARPTSATRRKPTTSQQQRDKGRDANLSKKRQ